MLEDEGDEETINTIPEETEGAEAGQETRPLTLGDFITGVLTEKVAIGDLESRRENSFGIAMGLVSRLVNTAYGIHPLYPKYLSAKFGKPELENLKSIDTDHFQCFVPIRRPTKPDTFKMVYKSPGEYPNHRILLCVNDNLFSVDKMQITKEWGHCVDTNGFLRPDFILRWFNDGLISATDFLEEARPRTAKKHNTMDLGHSIKKDGTLLIHFYTSQSIQPHLNLTINIVPCIPIMEVPKQCRLQVPIASRRPYYEIHTDFKKKIKETLAQGEKMFYLEATVMHWNDGCGYDPSIVCSWGLNIGSLEDRALNYISQMRTGKYFRDVIMLIERIKDVHVFCLHPLTNRVVLNAILYQHKKSMGVVKARSRWFIKILERISNYLKSGVFPAFFQNKYNLLSEYKSEELSFTAKQIDEMLVNLEELPENMYVYTGLESELEEIDEGKPYRDDPPKVTKVESKPTESKEEIDEDSLFDRTITTLMSEATDLPYDDTFCDEDSDEEPIFITGPVKYGFKRHEIRSASKMSYNSSRPPSNLSGHFSTSSVIRGSDNASLRSASGRVSFRSDNEKIGNGSISSKVSGNGPTTSALKNSANGSTNSLAKGKSFDKSDHSSGNRLTSSSNSIAEQCSSTSSGKPSRKSTMKQVPGMSDSISSVTKISENGSLNSGHNSSYSQLSRQSSSLSLSKNSKQTSTTSLGKVSDRPSTSSKK